MAENILRGLYRQLEEDNPTYSPSQHFVKFLAKHTSAMYITCMYAVHLLEKKEMKSFICLLPLIAKAYLSSDGSQLPDVFLHVLVLNLTSKVDTVRVATLQVILREFWMPCCQVTNVAVHISMIQHCTCSNSRLYRGCHLSEVQMYVRAIRKTFFGTSTCVLCREIYYTESLSRRVHYQRFHCT